MERLKNMINKRLISKQIIKKRLIQGLCPNLYCMQDKKTIKLTEISPLYYTCPKCKGEWEFVITDLNIGWLEVINPIVKED